MSERTESGRAAGGSTAERLLASLNDEQREAATALHGPVAILAGAGTGKTRTITHRIAYGVHTGVYDPSRVLAVSFTRKAAGELYTRLRALNVGEVRSQTFHSAALAQLNHFWPQVVGGPPPTLSGKKVPLITQAADAQHIRLDQETARDIAAEIEWRKMSMKTLAEYTAVVAERPTPVGVTDEQLLEVMTGYEELKQERRTIDFEDVLVLTAGMIETEPRVALAIHEAFRFFTVDEYQDLSPLQHAVLNAWLGERDDVCVVGDPSQTIYSFAGAKSHYLTRFAQEHGSARLFELQRNYRSTPEILHPANRLIRDQPGAIRLVPEAPSGGEVPRAMWFRDDLSEAAGVAAAIAQQLRNGVPASDIAVLARTNAQLGAFEAALAAEGVASQVHGARRFFDRAEIVQALAQLRGESVVPNGRPTFQVVSDIARGLGWTQTPPDSVAQRERWNALNALVNMVEQFPRHSLRQLWEELVAQQRAGHEPTVEAVTLTAIHSAKGLEWPVVYLAGCAEGLLPIHYAQAPDDIAEERRLAYVAMTRAKKQLRLSGSAAGGRKQRQPSRFLHEAGISIREVRD